jgi:hypothetical protein
MSVQMHTLYDWDDMVYTYFTHEAIWQITCMIGDISNKTSHFKILISHK